MNHTSGPWKVVEHYDGSRAIAGLRDFRPSIRVGIHVEADHDWVGSAAADQIFANARLIAAAPDLFQALQEVAGAHAVAANCFYCEADAGTPHDPDCTMHFVIAAIAKAEGRS